MTSVLVSQWMTANPLHVLPKMTLPQISAVMQKHRIRRLPVVDEDGMLVGIITSSDIRLAMPSDEEALRKFEVSALINAVEVDTIMTRDVITTTPDATLNQAAKLMLQHKVGALPVVENERLVGIITDSDIFRALVNDDSMWT